VLNAQQRIASGGRRSRKSADEMFKAREPGRDGQQSTRYIMADSAARGSNQSDSQLSAAAFDSKPSGELSNPITSNFPREGLTVLQNFILISFHALSSQRAWPLNPAL